MTTDQPLPHDDPHDPHDPSGRFHQALAAEVRRRSHPNTPEEPELHGGDLGSGRGGLCSRWQAPPEVIRILATPAAPGIARALAADVLTGWLETHTSRVEPGRTPDPAAVPLIWLTRAGALDTHDLDQLWFPAAMTAFQRLGLPLHRFVVITERGWADLVSGQITDITPPRRRRRRPPR